MKRKRGARINDNPFKIDLKPFKIPKNELKIPKNSMRIPKNTIKLSKINPIKFPKTNLDLGGTINTQTNAFNRIKSRNTPRIYRQNNIYKQEPVDVSKIIRNVSNTIKENHRKYQIRQQQTQPKMSLVEKIVRLNELAEQPRQEHRFSQIHEEISEYKKQFNELKIELHNEIKLIKEDIIRLKEERINILEKNVSDLQNTLYNMLTKKGITEEELIKYLENYQNSQEINPKYSDLIDKVENLSEKQKELEEYKADLVHLKRMNLDKAKDTTLN